MSVGPGPGRLGILWQLSSISGWGLYGVQVTRALLARGGPRPVLGLPPFRFHPSPLEAPLFAQLEAEAAALRERLGAARPGDRLDVDFPLLHALGEDLVPTHRAFEVTGRGDLGITFFVDPALDQAVVERARRYRAVVAGSTWNAVLLEAAGVANVRLVLQGVDATIFHPAPKARLFPGRFLVFSGGKLEFRKGQDIVVAAFREFHRRHPEALLIANWFNSWPKLIETMALSPHHPKAPILKEDGPDIEGWLGEQGLAPGSFRVLGEIPNALLGSVIRECDAALFPNRAEPGTNLVAMECLASGVPTILSANTGHLDFADSNLAFVLGDQGSVATPPFHRSTAGWGESKIEEIVDALERIFAHPERAAAVAGNAAARLAELAWPKQIERLLERLG
ncbi:MAG: glycosyltransferase family 4 protein [Rhodospirillales bacterium]|nr:glycosyltransferase family 4 protein [Rhodospirillales bacterium]